MARFDDVGLQYFDDAGNPLLYGKIRFDESGTNTLKTTFSDIDETAPNANPVVLDAAGRVPDIYFTGSARVTVFDQNDVQVGEVKDPITASGSAGGRLAFSDYNALSTYAEKDIVTRSDSYWMSLQDNNQGNTPGSSPTYWREVKFIENGRLVQLFKGADVASASTLTLGDDGNSFDVTGTTTIAGIATKGVGTVVNIRFTGALTLTHNATDFDLLSSANITTEAGDEAVFLEYATGDWRMIDYTRKSGQPLVSPSSAGEAKVWIVADVLGNILDSDNVTSITDGGAGIITVTIATDFGDADYTIVSNGAGFNGSICSISVATSDRAAGSFIAKCTKASSANEDPIGDWMFACFGAQ